MLNEHSWSHTLDPKLCNSEPEKYAFWKEPSMILTWVRNSVKEVIYTPSPQLVRGRREAGEWTRVSATSASIAAHCLTRGLSSEVGSPSALQHSLHSRWPLNIIPHPASVSSQNRPAGVWIQAALLIGHFFKTMVFSSVLLKSPSWSSTDPNAQASLLSSLTTPKHPRYTRKWHQFKSWLWTINLYANPELSHL